MTLAELRSVWVDVLNELEHHNRIAWMAMFDGRLLSLENNIVTLDFSDARKLAGHHDIANTSTGLTRHLAALESAITAITGSEITVQLLAEMH